MSKPATPAVAVGDGELGDLHRAGRVPHRGEQLADHDPAAGGGCALVEALLHRLDDLVQGEPGAQVLLGGVADLGVDHAVGRQVLDALARHPGQRRRGLHHRRRCGRTSPGSAPASRSRPPRRTSAPSDSASVAGSGWPICPASSRMVAGRSPPSRWSCSSTLGACRIVSRLRAVGSVAVALIGPSNQTAGQTGDRDARVHHVRRAGRGGRRGARHQRVGGDHPGAGRPVRRRDR